MMYNDWSGPSQGGGFICHGCETAFGSQTSPVKHKDGCTLTCVRPVCAWHVRGVDAVKEEVPVDWYRPVTPEIVRVDPELLGQIAKIDLAAEESAKALEETPEHLREWLDELAEEAKAIMRERGKKYGPGNIAEWGELGVLVRLSDKMARLRTMQQSGVSDFADESVEDTYMDIVNYAMIALAWRRGQWPGSEK